MEIDEWEKLYSESFSNISGLLKNINGVFVAYNSNVDAIKHIREHEVKRLINLLGCRNVQQRILDYPRDIKDPVDFMARLIIAMRDGKAAEVPTYTTDLHDWLMDNLVFDKA